VRIIAKMGLLSGLILPHSNEKTRDKDAEQYEIIVFHCLVASKRGVWHLKSTLLRHQSVFVALIQELFDNLARSERV
jgi:hypothetical protein